MFLFILGSLCWMIWLHSFHCHSERLCRPKHFIVDTIIENLVYDGWFSVHSGLQFWSWLILVINRPRNSNLLFDPQCEFLFSNMLLIEFWVFTNSVILLISIASYTFLVWLSVILKFPISASWLLKNKSAYWWSYRYSFCLFVNFITELKVSSWAHLFWILVSFEFGVSYVL